VRRTPLNLAQYTHAISSNDLQKMLEEEARMVAADRLAVETMEKKNAVESYVYDMKGKMNESLSTFATDSERNKLVKLLEDTESWLYGEGEAATKSTYVKKLDELRAIGDPISQRKYENDNRYDALMTLRSTIEQYKLIATTDDPKYDHIEKEEKNKVITECETAEKYINDHMNKQEKLPKSANPSITVAEILKKKSELEKFSSATMNKPKPKPKVEEPKPKVEEPKPEPSTSEQNQDQPKSEENKSNPNAKQATTNDIPQQMDLD